MAKFKEMLRDWFSNKHKWAFIMLACCIVLILIATLFGSMIQTAGWSATVEDLRGVSNSGTIKLVATDDGSTTAEEYKVTGKVSSGLLYVPKAASAENKRPAIVFTHGYLNNREMQLQNVIEMVRRGYVVLAIDYAEHGHNDVDSKGSNSYGAIMNGEVMLNAAKYLYNLPYVDQAKIGVSGHSMGAYCTAQALSLDGVFYGKQTVENFKAGHNMGIISAGLCQGNEAPTYAQIGNNVIAAGLVKASADEFFFKSNQKEAIYNPVHKDSVTKDNYVGLYLKKGKDYVEQTANDRYRKNAQYYRLTSSSVSSIFYLTGDVAYRFTRALPTNTNLSNIADWTTGNGTIYANGAQIAGKDGRKLVSAQRKGEALASATQSIRVVYEAKETHPMNHMSTKSASHIIDFFYNAFGRPEGVSFKAPTNQTWWLKETFAIFGFIGIFGMLLPLTDILLGTRLFASLKLKEGELEEAPLLLKKPRKHVSYWLSAILTAWFGAWSLKNMSTGVNIMSVLNISGLFPASKGFVYDNISKIAVWGMLCAGFAVAISGVIWIINRCINVFWYKEESANYDEHPFDGFKIRSWQNVLKTPLLAAILIGIFFGTSALLWRWTTVDFRFWTFDLRVFDLDRLPSMLLYVPFFFIFYMVSAALAKNYRVKDLPEWATIIINVAANVLGIVILIGIANQHYINTGAMVTSANNLWYIVAYPIIPCVATATILARRLYVRTGNAWLAGIVNAVIMTIMACANTAVSGNVQWWYNPTM